MSDLNDTASGELSDEATLGERILAARESAGLSEQDLATAIAVRAKTVEAWEGDDLEPRSNKLATLAGVLGVSPAWLLDGIGAGVSQTNAIEDGDVRANRERLISELEDAQAMSGQLEKRIERISSAIAALN